MPHLIYVRADTTDGENLDLLVVAADEAQAVKLWVEHYELTEGSIPHWTGFVPGVAPTIAPGVIPWEQIHHAT